MTVTPRHQSHTFLYLVFRMKKHLDYQIKDAFNETSQQRSPSMTPISWASPHSGEGEGEKVRLPIYETTNACTPPSHGKTSSGGNC